MGTIIIVMPKAENAQHIRDTLIRRGLSDTVVCTTASMALTRIHQLYNGVIVCGSHLPDMHYTQLLSCLPDGFEMLLLTSFAGLEDCPSDVMTLTYPVKPSELAGTAAMMLAQQERRLKKKKVSSSRRTQQEQNFINNAKWVLMERNHMSEEEAFRYIQKCSMDSGTNMVETAQMILLMIYDS